MASRFRTAVAVAVVALLPTFVTTTAFADDPTPKPTLNYVEAPLDRPPSTTAKEVASEAGAEATTPAPAPKDSNPTPAPETSSPAPQTGEPGNPPQLAQTGGSRDIWLTGFSLLCIWTGSAVVTYGRERKLKR